MAAKPKLTPEQWADVRKHWEGDPRDGYAWLVDELALPVSAPAVRKAALRDQWAKTQGEAVAAPAASYSTSRREESTQKSEEHPSGVSDHHGRVSAATRAPARPRKEKEKSKGKGNSGTKVSGENHAKVSETISETMSGAKTLPATMAEAVEADPDQFGVLAQLTDKQEIFVREYMVDWNATQAAIRAGYSSDTAGQIAYQLLQNPSVRDAIETLASARARRLGIDADELMRLWSTIIAVDANEIAQFRRVCCPYCYGTDHQRQYTPEGLAEAKRRHDRDRARTLKTSDGKVDIGEFPEYTDDWYDKRKEPHEDCPECFGEGFGETFFHDTRKLSPGARFLYGGVKEGRDGIEILTLSKEKAMDNLARALGLFKEKDVEVNINMVSGDDLHRLYAEKMQQARARQVDVLEERGLIEAQPSASTGD